MSQPSRCHKDAYRSWSDALRVVKRMQRVERIQGRRVHGQAPYKCGDHFHLTSHSYNKRKAA